LPEVRDHESGRSQVLQQLRGADQRNGQVPELWPRESGRVQVLQ